MISNSETENHVINIWEMNKDHLKFMQQKISNPPKILTLAASKPSCCIFKVPTRFVEINGKSYQPHIVSIGPYHHSQPHLKMIEEHKWHYLGNLLSRVKAKGLTLEGLLRSIEPLEKDARDCYSEFLHFNKDDFLEMMLLDGCFIIEWLRKVGNVVQVEDDDPIFTMQWITAFFTRDLLLLENQIPFFVLERLFELTKIDEESLSLSSLALNYFNRDLLQSAGAFTRFCDLKGRHLLDLVRSSYIDFDQAERYEEAPTPSHIIHCVSRLCRGGIKLTQGNTDSFLAVKFKNRTIEMPTIIIDDAMSSFLLNCIAYEQCHNGSSKHFTTYATFLSCLVSTFDHMEYLCDRNIIANYFGTDDELVRFIKNLGKEVALDIDRCYLAKLFNDVNRYYYNDWHVPWNWFKLTHCDTPWFFISASAACLLLILTVVQTFYTVYGTYV
ncbi:hypothetical protein M5689_006818 [Euphorbia peplus]|nr:hypothetical protein M5689_006818 [Euphorbia peplus]